MRDQTVTFGHRPERDTVKAMSGRALDVVTTDQSGLYARARLSQPSELTIGCRDHFEKEPLGPRCARRTTMVRHVKWVAFALCDGGKNWGSLETVDEGAVNPTRPTSMRVVGTEGNYGEKLRPHQGRGLPHIQACGKYGEVCSTQIAGKFVKIARGVNALWNKGGLPIRARR